MSPYKNPEKQRTADRESHRRRTQVKRLAKYKEDGKFNVKAFLEDNLELIASDLLNPGKGIPSKKTEMMLKILDIYSDKQEVKHSIELTVADRQQAYREFIGELQREAKTSGICPVCGQPEKVCIEMGVHTESKHS